jgi:hypothetical protein
MNFAGEIVSLGRVDIAPLRAAVAALDEARWHEDESRQQLFDAHASTATIKLIFDADYRHTQPTVWPAFAQFEPVVAPILALVRDSYARTLRQRRWIARHGEGYFVRAILTRLPPGGRIKPHADGGYSLARCHRVHVPVESSAACTFQVGGTSVAMQPGEVWEINNRLTHAVSNDGDAPRIHLILDFVQPGETVLDHDGALVA